MKTLIIQRRPTNKQGNILYRKKTILISQAFTSVKKFWDKKTRNLFYPKKFKYTVDFYVQEGSKDLKGKLYLIFLKYYFSLHFIRQSYILLFFLSNFPSTIL
jgi:hypothetical protein